MTALTWDTAIKNCDPAKWDPVTACHGVDIPWAYGSLTDYTSATVKGGIRAWHFLAEKNADVTKNFQIEKDNKINWIIEEKSEKWDTAPATVLPATTYAHKYGTFTSTGATSTILGATAIIAGVVASMF